MPILRPIRGARPAGLSLGDVWALEPFDKSIDDETVGVPGDEMLTHSATNFDSAGSGMREHFDDLTVDFVLSESAEDPLKSLSLSMGLYIELSN